MTVEWCTETLLVEVVSDEPNATTKHEQAIQRANLDVLIGLFRCECTTVAQEVDKADRNAAVNVENQLQKGMSDQLHDERVETYGIFLGSGHLLDSEGIVQEGVAREVLLDILLDELNTKIRVVHTLDLVSNSADWKDIQKPHHRPNKYTTH
jgi:hypothetical protein